MGGGNPAAADVIYLARICRKVYLVHRRDKLRATAIYHERLRELGNVEFCWDSVAEEFITGESGRVTGLKLRNVKTDDERVLAASAVFIAIGMRPYTAFLEGDLETDGGGYIVADAMGRTTMPGVFAAAHQGAAPGGHSRGRRRQLRPIRLGILRGQGGHRGGALGAVKELNPSGRRRPYGRLLSACQRAFPPP